MSNPAFKTIRYLSYFVVGLILSLGIFFIVSISQPLKHTDVQLSFPVDVAKLSSVSSHEMFMLSSALQRPLFWQERRPLEIAVEFVEESKPVPNQVLSLDNVKLLGVHVGAGLESSILIARNDAVESLVIGDVIDGWRLEFLGADTAVFVNEADDDSYYDLQIKRHGISSAWQFVE